MEYPLGTYLDNYTLLDQPGVSAQLTDMVRIYPWFTLGRYMHLRSLQRTDPVGYNRAARQLDVRLFAHPYPRILIEEDESVSVSEKIQLEHRYQVSDDIGYAGEVYYTELPQHETSDLIEDFLNRDGRARITPPPISTMEGDSNYDEHEDISLESVREDGEIASETLAQIYIEQGLPDKAIEIYYTLSLKYPEKSVFFANLIADIQTRYSNWQTTDYK